MVVLKLQMEIFYRLPSLLTCIWILRTVMYPSAKTRPEPSQATKINAFVRIVKVFKLMLLTIFGRSTIMYVWTALIIPLIYSDACN